MARLLLIDRTLLSDEGQPHRERLETLIPYTHGLWRLLIVAWQPEQWRPTRRSVDEGLVYQQQAHEQLMRWGADLDGFIYLPSPVFGRRRQRAGVLSGVIKRYRLEAKSVWLVSGRSMDIDVGIMAGVNTVHIGNKKPIAGALQVADLAAAIKHLPQN